MIQTTFDDLREFAEYATSHAQDQYVSLYLNTDPADPENRAQTPAWQIYLKNAIATIEQNLDPVQTRQWKNVRLRDTDPDKAWARTRKRLEKYLTSFRPKAKTLALFISQGSEHRFELPVRLDNVHYYGEPHMQEILWAMDEYELHLVVLMAEDEARMMHIGLGQTADDATVVVDQRSWRQGRKGMNVPTLEARRDELTRRFVRMVAADVDKHFFKEHDVERIILGGDQRLANSLLSQLHPAVREKVIGVLPIPIDRPAHEIVSRTRDVAEQAEREYEDGLVTEVVSQAGARGRGAAGTVAVSHALDRAAVRLLLLPYPAADDIEPLLLQAVHQGAQVEFLHGEPAEQAAAAGGVLAQLYYAIN
ncbi:MAG TPA: hypothetical protein PKJ56_03825 [Promineifilum sp.]|nr:hypothetical protein [Promineifilum sp.]